MTKLKERRKEIGETKVSIKCDSQDGIEAAIESIRGHKKHLENFISKHPEFKTALEPYPMNMEAPSVVEKMIKTTSSVGVGPMAAVAGVLADLGAQAAIQHGARTVLVENGGEIAILGENTFHLQAKAGNSPLSGRIGFKITSKDVPIGIGTSSGTEGHALSFGVADAATIIADNAGLADAAATAICNAVKGKNFERAVENGLKRAKEVPGIRGAVIFLHDYVGIWGRLPNLAYIQQPYRSQA